MKQTLVIGNWKMNLLSEKENVDFSKNLISSLKPLTNKDVEIGVAPMPIHFSLVKNTLREAKSSILVGSQNCSDKNQGAYTGEISAKALKMNGGNFVIVGHSERRAYQQETDECIKNKIINAFENDLTVILCIGETEEEKSQGNTNKVLEKQLEHTKGLLDSKKIDLSHFVIAYEPRWAIGTGKIPTMDEISSAHSFIKKMLAVDGLKVLYGGSVNVKNCNEIAKVSGVDGFLVGGASLKVEDFKAIVESMQK